MTRDEILKEFTAKTKDFKQMALNISNAQDAEDLFQEVTLMLLEFPEARLISYYNPTQGLKPIFLRMLCNQYKSKTSKFHAKYRKQEQFIQKKGSDIVYNEPQSEVEYDSKYFDRISEACNDLYDQAVNPQVAELEKMIWELYIETGSLRKTASNLPEDYRGIVDLKTVHVVVQKYQRTIKGHLSTLP